MNQPKEFREYITKGIIKKCSADKPRAEYLISESQKSLAGLNRRLQIMGIDDDNTNSIIKDCYDILMEALRANLLLAGYNSSGQFAHEAEVSYFRELGFTDTEINFLNELRYFRNSVTYYGKILTAEYAQKVVQFTQRIYPELQEKYR